MSQLQFVIASEAKQSRAPLDCGVAALLAMTLLATGCAESHSDEIAACREFLKGGLRSPSTYQEASVNVSEGEDVGQYDRRNVLIEYDAANAFGTPVRGTQLCSFEIDKETRKLKGSASTAATIAKADRALGRGDGSCCVAHREPDPNDPTANMTLEPLSNELDEGQN